MSPRSLIGAVVCTLLFAIPSGLAQQMTLPPSVESAVSLTCPMHPDVLATQAGVCPICKMDLVPVRLASVFSCPVHSVVTRAEPGSCPICQRALVPLTVSITYRCASGTEKPAVEPGACADGSARAVFIEPRAHGDHNPRHGGQFFMAPDNWHHLEGTYPSPGMFRLFVYDDFTRPLATRGMHGRVVTRERIDERTGELVEVFGYPLLPDKSGEFMQAHLDPIAAPRELTVKVRFEPGATEHRFDFVFSDATSDRAEPPASVPDPTLVTIPEQPEAIMAALDVRERTIGELIAAGNFAMVYVPALEAKELALALGDRVGPKVAPRDRRAFESALDRVVRAAWELDVAGDQGIRQRLTALQAELGTALGDLRLLLP